MQKKASISEERMDEILRSHVINPNFLRADDFHNFLQQRQNALLERIEKAMGKTLVSDTHQSEDTELVDLDE